MQEDNIRHSLCAAALERIVGQAHCTDEVTALRDVLAGAGIFFVQCTAGGDKRHNAAGAQLVDSLCKEIVVDGKVQPIILRVVDLKIAERHIANGTIKIVIGEKGVFIACDLDIGFLIQLLGNAARNAVQFHAVEFGITAAKMSVGEKCTCTHAGFKDFAAIYAEALQRTVDGMDNSGRRIKSRQCTAAGGFILGFGQCFFQLAVLVRPCTFVRVKRIGKAAPAGVLCQNFLLVLKSGAAAVGYTLFNLFQLLNGGDIGRKLFARRCRQVVQIGRFVGDWLPLIGSIIFRKSFHILHDL